MVSVKAWTGTLILRFLILHRFGRILGISPPHTAPEQHTVRVIHQGGILTVCYHCQNRTLVDTIESDVQVV